MQDMSNIKFDLYCAVHHLNPATYVQEILC